MQEKQAKIQDTGQGTVPRLTQTGHTTVPCLISLLPAEVQAKNILKAHKKGVSIRQLSHFTGVSKGIIERIIKETK